MSTKEATTATTAAAAATTTTTTTTTSSALRDMANRSADSSITHHKHVQLPPPAPTATTSKLNDSSFQVPVGDTTTTTNTGTPFYLFVHGTIDGAEHSEAPGSLYCHYCIVKGPDWAPVHPATTPGLALDEGVTQLSCCSSGLTPSYVWNHPLQVTLSSNNPFGWPRLVVAVYTVAGDKDVVKGYGWQHIPFRSGTHKVRIPLFVPTTPLNASPVTQMFSGYKPEFRDPTWICQSVGHELIRVRGVRGAVKLTLNVVLHQQPSLTTNL